MKGSNLSTFPNALLTQLYLIGRRMGPEVHVGQHKEATITVVVLAWNVCSLARHGGAIEDVLCPRMVICPAARDSGVLLINFALPFKVQVRADGLADGRQTVTAPCAYRKDVY